MEFGTVFHQFQEGIFPLCTYFCEVCEIDDEFAAVKMFLDLRVLAEEFCDPRLDESALKHQSASAWALHHRNLQHSTHFVELRECNTLAKVWSCNYLNFQEGCKSGRNEVAVSICAV